MATSFLGPPCADGSQDLQGNEQAWILVEDEDFKGVVVMVDSASGEAISLSCKNRRDVDRWETSMPSLVKYPSLQTLNLHKCRYLSQLHDSIGQLPQLRRLQLTQCERLVSLPASIDQLNNLQEVRNVEGMLVPSLV